MNEWLDIRGLAEWRDESVSTVRRKLPQLYALGFPQPVAGKWSLPACRRWATGENEGAPGAYDPLMQALDERASQH